MTKQITVSAPGKLMLLGEHAVVYDRPCLVTAVGQRMKATITLTESPFFELNAPDVNVANYRKPISALLSGEVPKGAKFVEVAVANFFGKYPLKSGGIKIETNSEFSAEFGFGSSSASTVCTIKALSEITGANLDQKAIFDLAYKTVLDIQGKGSGFDVAAATYGGTLYFVTGGKVIEPLKVENLPIVVGYSGIKVDTVTLINQVSEKAKKYPEVIEAIYDQIKNLVEKAKKAVLEKDWATVGELMNINEGVLSALGVESQKLADMIYAAREAGAYGAKLSGAGIGDCMIAFTPTENRDKINQSITNAGGKVIDVQINVEGVRIENV